MDSVHERELLERVRTGDADALAELLRQCQGRVYNVCLRMVSNRDDAAELTQDVLVKVIEKIDTFRGDALLSTWITRIAMNQSMSFLRKAKLRRTASLDATVNGQTGEADPVPWRNRLEDQREPGPDRRVEQEERLAALKVAMAELEADHRAVLVLRDLEQMDYRQIAEVLDLTLGTVKSRLFRARAALRQRMAQRYPELNETDPAGAPAPADQEISDG